MKCIRLLALLLLGLVALYSCQDKECETFNYSSVTITNNLDEAFVFDVSYEKNETGDWIDNFETKINVGESYTWTEVGAGDIRTWLNMGNDNKVVLDDTKLSSCNDRGFNYENQCELFGTGFVVVINETGQSIVVDLKTTTGFVEEVPLNSNEQVTYSNVPSGLIEYWYKFVDNDNWIVSDTNQLLVECDSLEFTWTSKKSGSLLVKSKPKNIESDSCKKVEK